MTMIRALRKLANKTVSEVARETETRTATLCEIECTPGRRVGKKLRDKLARYYGVPFRLLTLPVDPEGFKGSLVDYHSQANLAR
jgi:transcriptional regulator with XRE-family HTH domain